MTTGWKKRVALLLAATMVITGNTFAFAAQTFKAEESKDSYSVQSTSDSQDSSKSDYVTGMLATTPVSSIKDDPEKWSTAPDQAPYTYGVFLPELYGYDDNDMVSADMIVNGKHVTRPAIVPKESFWVDRSISFNCVKIGSDNMYLVYAYGIGNEFDNYYGTPSENNYYGMSPDGVMAGVFDYTPFSWAGKDGSAKANGKVVFEAAVIKWSGSGEAEKQRIYEINKLTFKNNLYATVSYNIGSDGKWIPINYNCFQKNSKKPSVYPVMKTRKSYRDVKGTKVKVTKDEKKALKNINKALKNNKINFEIRRRPLAGTASSDYVYPDGTLLPESSTYKYASLMGDDLDFKSSGKLKEATLQFKSITSKEDTDNDTDSVDKDADAGEGNTTAKSRGFYLTHVLKMEKIKDSDQNNKDLEKNINDGNYRKKKKTDTWYRTEKIDGDDVLIVYGANNLEGVAAFRKRSDKTIGFGYYNTDKDCFISSVD